MNKKMKKFLSFISSLKVAIFLLILIAIYIVIGTMLPQHGTQELYEQRYPTISSIIITLHLDKAYSSPIFFSAHLSFCHQSHILYNIKPQRTIPCGKEVILSDLRRKG